VTLSPTGFVYVANQQDNTVSAYSGGLTGALTPVSGSPFATGCSPVSVTADPTGGFAYVANYVGSISVYTIGSTGALTPAPGSPFTGFNYPVSVAASPLVPFAVSTTNFETEAGTPATFTLSESFTLGKNSTGIDPVTERVVMRIGTFAVTIPAGSFTMLANGTFNFDGTINQVTYKVTIAPLGNNSFKFTANAKGLDLTRLGKQVPVLLAIGFNGTGGMAPHKQ
jgi:6-phosphogluconolactonase